MPLAIVEQLIDLPAGICRQVQVAVLIQVASGDAIGAEGVGLADKAAEAVVAILAVLHHQIQIAVSIHVAE